MRLLLIALTILFSFTLFSSVSYSGEMGTILWEKGIDNQFYSKISKKKMLFFPGVPLGGRAPKEAVLIGVIDSGVQRAHPQLAGYLRNSKDFTGEGDTDVLGHGTAVALIVLYGTGLANPLFEIVSAKVVDHESNIKKKHLIEAIDWIAGQHVKVVNLSLGFTGSREENNELCKAITKHGDVVFVAAAGNSGPDVKMYPAACELPNLISVEAVEDDGSIAAYSGRGDFMAPGNKRFQEEWYYYYEDAQRLAMAGRYDEARRLYERSIDTDSNQESEFQIGLIDLTEKKVDAALVRFKKAITIEPSFAEAHEMLGAVYYIKKTYQEAEKELTTAIDLYPETSETKGYRARAHFNLGQVLLKTGRKGAAKEEFMIVKQLMPTYNDIDGIIKSVNLP